MALPLIGITCGEIINRDHPHLPKVYGQSFTYSDAVARNGGIPTLLPFLNDVTRLRALYDRLDGIVFAGGNDVDPSLYDEQPHPKLGEISTARDFMELQLLNWAIEDDKPVLAICRGMQLLNVAQGGSLYQDIKSQLPEAMDHTQSESAKELEAVDQALKIAPESRLADILGSLEVMANTYHHQAVKDIGEGLTAVAWAEDAIVEGLEMNGQTFIIGVQCHPESIEQKSEVRWQKLFRAFTNAAASAS